MNKKEAAPAQEEKKVDDEPAFATSVAEAKQAQAQAQPLSLQVPASATVKAVASPNAGAGAFDFSVGVNPMVSPNVAATDGARPSANINASDLGDLKNEEY